MENDGARTMLEDPGLSRQWLVRRLQRALTLDLAAGALRHGIAGGAAASEAERLREFGQLSDERVSTLRRCIDELGSRPYGSVGLTPVLGRFAGRLLGVMGRRVWRPLLRRIAVHTLAEYDALAAFAADAVTAPRDAAARLRPFVGRLNDEVTWLEATR